LASAGPNNWLRSTPLISIVFSITLNKLINFKI
jgi:hypothetical protein